MWWRRKRLVPLTEEESKELLHAFSGCWEILEPVVKKICTRVGTGCSELPQIEGKFHISTLATKLTFLGVRK